MCIALISKSEKPLEPKRVKDCGRPCCALRLPSEGVDNLLYEILVNFTVESI